MKSIGNIRLAGVLFLLMLAAACGTTRLVSSWKAPEVSDLKFNKVLVIGLMSSKDRNLRENVERIIVGQLQAKGVNAGSAFAEYGPKTFEDIDEPTAFNKLKDKGYDGVITIALLDKSKEKTYTPGMAGYYPMPYRFWGYYRSVYARVYEPGYYSVNNNFMLEGNLYQLNNDKLVYSAQTKSVNPASPESLATEFSNKIFEDMSKKGVIK